MNAQEQFWSGEFGNDYSKRNVGRVASNAVFFAKALAQSENIRSIIEFGANIGENVEALKRLYDVPVSAVEINELAAKQLERVADQVFYHSMLGFNSSESWDLTFTKGVLIHIAPEDLDVAYETLYTYSRRYILIAEYYNPKPVTIPYRGNIGFLWKRDFCGEFMDKYPDCRLIDYGFTYHRDPFPQDDLNWFLLEK